MKKFIFILFSFGLLTTAYAQKKDLTNPAKTNATDPEEATYNRAVKYGDYEAAKNAIYTLIQKHPDNKSYLDSLVRLYFTMAAYPQCILAGNDYLQGGDTNNTSVMELVAIANSSINRNKEALELWEKLWTRTGNDQYAYQLAVNQYLLKRFGECAQTIDIILKDPAADKQVVSISLGENGSRKVPMKAAANNLLGVIQKELSMKDKAKESFEAALKISPDFDLAKNNLAEMNKSETPKEAPKEDAKQKDLKKK